MRRWLSVRVLGSLASSVAYVAQALLTSATAVGINLSRSQCKIKIWEGVGNYRCQVPEGTYGEGLGCLAVDRNRGCGDTTTIFKGIIY